MGDGDSATGMKFAVVVLAAAALLIAGCGSAQPGVTATAAGGTLATFRSTAGCFSISYDPRLFYADAQLSYDTPGVPPSVVWNTWPATLGNKEPTDAPAAEISVSATDWFANGMTSGNVLFDASWYRSQAQQGHGRFETVRRGGLHGFRAEWVEANDNNQRQVLIMLGLVQKHLLYHISAVCLLSHWPRLRTPMTAVLGSFRVLP